jgi:hypothetical protein
VSQTSRQEAQAASAITWASQATFGGDIIDGRFSAGLVAKFWSGKNAERGSPGSRLRRCGRKDTA